VHAIDYITASGIPAGEAKAIMEGNPMALLGIQGGVR
jgi:hypothetical protein